jgi:hypothetical protein
LLDQPALIYRLRGLQVLQVLHILPGLQDIPSIVAFAQLLGTLHTPAASLMHVSVDVQTAADRFSNYL